LQEEVVGLERNHQIMEVKEVMGVAVGQEMEMAVLPQNVRAVEANLQ
jgi:hypothetical protein